MVSKGTITEFGRRIWEQCPSSKSSLGIKERTLIERLGGLGSYGDYQRALQQLVEAGYLVQDLSNQTYKRSLASEKE